MPNYQTFRGYPDVVGNFNAGQDRGRQMAADDFNTRQTVETQNALLQRSNAAGAGAQSYPDLQAMQMQAKQLTDMYTPILNSALVYKNPDIIKKISEVYQQSNNPILQKLAGPIGSIQILDKDKYKVRYKTDSPEELAALQKAMPSLKNHPQIQPGIEYEFELEGGWGDPNTRVHSALPVEAKGGESKTSLTSEEDVEYWVKTIPDSNPKKESIRQHLLGLVKRNKGAEVRADLRNGVLAGTADVTGLSAAKAPTTRNRDVGDKQITEEWRDGAWVKVGEAPRWNTQGGFGSAWKLTPEELAAITRAIDEKRLNPNKVNSRTAKVYAGMELEKPGMSFSGKAADIEADSKSLGNQQKIRDMMASFVSNMNSQIIRMGEITQDLARTDARLLNVPIRQLGMRVKGSAIESKVTMYLTEISNEIGKLSTGSAASVAELSLGAQQKWDKIHDPNLSVRDLMSLLKETQHAGNLRMKSVDDTISKTKGRLEGVPKSGGVPSLDDYIKMMVAKHPQYKSKTRAEWQAAYDKNVGSK